ERGGSKVKAEGGRLRALVQNNAVAAPADVRCPRKVIGPHAVGADHRRGALGHGDLRRSGEEDFRGARHDSEGSTRKNAAGADIEALVGKDHLEAARNHNFAEDQRGRVASGTVSELGSIGGSYDNSLDQKDGAERREHGQEKESGSSASWCPHPAWSRCRSAPRRRREPACR